MFILKLGAEALSLKNECLEMKCKETAANGSCETSSTSSTMSETNGHMLENLLNGCMVESALLSEDPQIKRCKSVSSTSKSAFIPTSVNQNCRLRSDTVPQRTFLAGDKLQKINNEIRKRKMHSNINFNQTQSILFDSLSKQVSPEKRALINPIISLINGNKRDFLPPRINSTEVKISEAQPPSYSALSVDETKRLRAQINLLLKKIMQIIKSYSNYSSISESRRLSFVSHLWYKIIVLAIIQMDADSCRFMFRWLLLSIFNDKDEISCSRRDRILLLEKLQEYVKSYFWLKRNTEILHCVLFWFFSKYGYPDIFFMSPQAVMCKLNDLVSDKGQLESVLKLIHELSEITEGHVRQLFCQHLPTASSMAEFLTQWT